MIGNPNTSSVVCQNRNGLKHSSDVLEACNSIPATNHRVAPNLLHKQVVVNESVALNLISKVANSSDFNKNNDILSTTFEIVQDEIMKPNDEKVDGNATSFPPIGLIEKVVKSFGSYRSMGLNLTYSCDCIVREGNDTYCRVFQLTCFANYGKAFEVHDDAAVQPIALTATFLPGNLSGAAANIDNTAEICECGVLTILVRKSCCVFFLSFFFISFFCQKIKIEWFFN